jgi:hypothetical protein
VIDLVTTNKDINKETLKKGDNHGKEEGFR